MLQRFNHINKNFNFKNFNLKNSKSWTYAYDIDKTS